ncbi:MAG: class I SAM-dependent methyltransferase [bacterium]
MEEYKYSGNYDDPLLSYLYDQEEKYTDDIELLRRLIGSLGQLNILECFSGTGRILIPLAQDGHIITGSEIAQAMNARAVEKIAKLGNDIKSRVTLKVQDVLDGQWGADYDLVIMGANAFYELPSAATQEKCIIYAYESLIAGGYLYIDNNDFNGDWNEDSFGKERVIFEGKDESGNYGRYTMTGHKVDKENGILYIKRGCLRRNADGSEEYKEYIGKKHPVTAGEVENWLKKYRFNIIHLFGDRKGTSYGSGSDRAIFWAQKRR